MKKVQKKVWALILFFMLGTTCFPAEVFASAGNDTYAVATPIATNQALTNQLTDDSDVDWYKYTVDFDGYIYFELTSSEVEARDFDIAVYNESLSLLSQLYSYGEIVQNTIRFPYERGTVLYIKVSDHFLGHAVGKNYTLTPKAVVDISWESQPNNTQKKADKLFANKVKYGTLSSDNDKDIYEFLFPANGTVYFKLNNIYANSDSQWHLKIYDSSCNEMLSHRNNRTSYSINTRNLNYKKGTKIYVEITDFNDTLDVVYSLEPIFIKTNNWERESNDTMQKATSLVVKKAKSGTLWSANDIDYYGFKATKSGTLKYVFSVNDGVTSEYGYNVDVLDSSGKILKSAYDLKINKSFSFKVTKGKKYYLRVQPRYNSENLSVPTNSQYKVKVVYK